MSAKRQISHSDFLREFPKQNKQNLYYIVGSEPYLVDIVQKAIIKRFLHSEVDEFDFIIMYGDVNPAAEILEQLEMAPFMSQSRLIILRAFDQLKPSDKNLIADYTILPLNTSILVIIADAHDARLKSSKIIEENATMITCRSPYGTQDLIHWLREELNTKKIKMNNEAISLFAGNIESDYSVAANELEKLIIYTKNRSEITLRDVEEVVGKSRTNKIFDLQNALGQRNLKSSLQILDNMMSNEDPDKIIIFIIIMLCRYFLIIWKIQALRNRSMSDSEIISRHLNDVFFKFRNDYIEAARNYSYIETKKIMSLLLQADIDAKSSNIKEEILLHTLVCNICLIGK